MATFGFTVCWNNASRLAVVTFKYTDETEPDIDWWENTIFLILLLLQMGLVFTLYQVISREEQRFYENKRSESTEEQVTSQYKITH